MRLPETTGRYRMRIAMQIILLMLLPVFAFSSDFQTPVITAQELHDLLENTDQPLVIDVRERAEYKTGHVPGAINIPQKKLARQLDKLADASSVVLYCYNGRRTRLAEQTLIENDIPNVFHLEGGLIGWRQGGFEVRTGWK